MLNELFRRVKILAMIGLLSGCSDATPAIGLLRSFQDFEFTTSNIVTASLTSIPIEAKCSSFLSAIEMSFDGGTTWVTPTSYDPSADSACASGIFKVTLSNTKAPWNTMSFSNGQTIEVKFRIQPRMGDWIYKSLTITYTPSSTASQEVLAGAQTQTGAGLQLHGKIRHADQQASSGGNFIIKSRIVK